MSMKPGFRTSQTGKPVSVSSSARGEVGLSFFRFSRSAASFQLSHASCRKPLPTRKMAARRPGFTRYLMPASSLLAVLSLSGGIYGLLRPYAWASAAFGVSPSSIPSIAEEAYASFAAARNLGSGITLAGLVVLGNKKAVGVFLMSGVVTALTDSWICTKLGGEKALGHAVMGLLIAAWGWGVWLSGIDQERPESSPRDKSG